MKSFLMKQIAFTVLFIASTFVLNAQTYETLKDRDGTKMYKGFITDALLKTDTAFNWYPATQKIYNPKEKVVKTFAANKDSVSLVIFMGTWCEDSHFIIPRFYKTLDSAGFDKNKISLIAVDRTKKDLTNLATTLNITNVPTIIVYKKGKEIGRVIEYGNTGKYDEEVAALINGSK